MTRKIAIIRPDGNPLNLNSYNSQEVGLAKGLSENEIDVDIFMSNQTNSEKTITVDCKGKGTVKIYTLPCIVLPLISHAIFPTLIAALKKTHYDAIQVNEENELTCFWVSRYAAKNNIPLVLYQGMYRPISGRIRNWFQKFYDISLAKSFRNNLSFAFAKTTSAKQYLEDKGYHPVEVMPVGIDLEKLTANHDPIDCRSEYGLPKNSKILLYIGSIESRRNPDFLVDIAKTLESSNYFLLIAGGGPLKEHISNRIIQEKITNVKLLGSIPQFKVKSLYEDSDVFLLASNYEIYGMVVLEALIFGCPVISTKTAGPIDMIENRLNGYLIDKLDTTLWKLKILEAVEGIDRKKIQHNARMSFDWVIIAKKYTTTIFKITGY